MSTNPDSLGHVNVIQCKPQRWQNTETRVVFVLHVHPIKLWAFTNFLGSRYRLWAITISTRRLSSLQWRKKDVWISWNSSTASDGQSYSRAEHHSFLDYDGLYIWLMSGNCQWQLSGLSSLDVYVRVNNILSSELMSPGWETNRLQRQLKPSCLRLKPQRLSYHKDPRKRILVRSEELPDRTLEK